MIFCIVHYNTPELTTCLISSILKFHRTAKIVVFDNSNLRVFDKELFDITYIDNTSSQLINFDNEISKHNIDANYRGCFGSIKHSLSIDFLIKHYSDFILLDADVLLKKSIDFIDKSMFIISDIIHITNDHYRFSPQLMYINSKKLLKHNIKFFNANRILGLYGNLIDDTGAAVFQDIVNTFPYKTICQSDYIEHYGNGSWRKENKKPIYDGGRVDVYENISYKAWLMKYKSYWM